ncbi:DUF6520 family protein [Algoriphagus sp.]|uniref:DUF6520 family protein n=1 Tax=Algoriphagus sp. TaxID=1872435 RepID=UPI00327FA957
MKKLEGKLPLLAFVVAAFAAVAFTGPKEEDPMYARIVDNQNNVTWLHVNDPQNPVDYDCDSGSEFCLYSEPNDSAPIGTANKEFVLN